MRGNFPRPQRGAAILAAMLVTATVAALSAGMIGEMNRWFSRSESARNTAQAQSLAAAALRWTAQYLDEESRLGPLDHLGELWATGLPPTPVEGGTLAGNVNDAQGRFNLNNIVDDKRAWSEKDLAFAQQLFARIRLPAAQISAIFSQIQRKPLAHLGELSMVSATAMAAIGEQCTALPSRTAINVNTAPAALLLALNEKANAQSFADRVVKPFTSTSDFTSRTGIAPQVDIAVGSKYFFVNTEAVFGNGRAAMTALIERKVGVLWQVQGS